MWVQGLVIVFSIPQYVMENGGGFKPLPTYMIVMFQVFTWAPTFLILYFCYVLKLISKAVHEKRRSSQMDDQIFKVQLSMIRKLRNVIFAILAVQMVEFVI